MTTYNEQYLKGMDKAAEAFKEHVQVGKPFYATVDMMKHLGIDEDTAYGDGFFTEYYRAVRNVTINTVSLTDCTITKLS